MKKRFEALDALRGLCAICVVLFHMHVVSTVTQLRFIRGSAILVEFFFVLSGFVLAHGYGFREDLRLAPAIKSRFYRLFPLHAVMLLVMIVLEFGKLMAYRKAGVFFNNKPFTGTNAVGEVLPNLLLMQSWLPFCEEYSFNYPSWSISVELYIYIIFFCSIVLLPSKKLAFWSAVPVVILFSMLILDSSRPHSTVVRGLFCFFSGSTMYHLYMKYCNIYINKLCATLIEIGLVLFSIIMVCSNSEEIYLPTIAVFAAAVFAFSLEGGFVSAILKNKPFQVIGKLSYSIYMTHAAIILCLISMAAAAGRMTGTDFSPMVDGVRSLDFGNILINNCVVISIVLITIATSCLTYTCIEEPGRRVGKKKTSDMGLVTQQCCTAGRDHHPDVDHA